MSKKTKPTKKQSSRSTLPAIRLVSVKSEARQEHITGTSWGGELDGLTIIFPTEVTIETEPKMNMEGVGSVIINGTTFHKPFNL